MKKCDKAKVLHQSTNQATRSTNLLLLATKGTKVFYDIKQHTICTS